MGYRSFCESIGIPDCVSRATSDKAGSVNSLREAQWPRWRGDFINYVVKKFPFRIRTIRTDRGHEFQALFHWHVADQGMDHVYIKPRTPQLNGKVERSHRTDKDEFYQLLTYRDDVDLKKKLAAWEKFYNYDRPHGAHKGKTPYEALREKLS